MNPPSISGFANVSDIRLHYQIHGEGPPMLLLHGNGEDLRIFDPLLESLAGIRRIIAVDTRGHGQSGRGEKPFRFETFAADMLELMRLLELPSADVLGFSDGGNLALHMALLEPEKIGKIILMGANLNPSGIKRRVQLPIIAGYQLVRAIAAVDKSARLKRDILGLMVHHPKLTPGHLASIPCPTLVIAGERDIVKPDHTRLIAASLPKSRLEILPGLGHFVLAKPDILLPPILTFLNGTI